MRKAKLLRENQDLNSAVRTLVLRRVSGVIGVGGGGGRGQGGGLPGD